LECGVDLKVIQEFLGHSNYAIPANLYTHVAEKLDRQATDRLDSLFLPR
jgi:site-specific recombinase XerD